MARITRHGRLRTILRSLAIHVAAHAVAGFIVDGRIADITIGLGAGQYAGRLHDGVMYLSRSIQECQLLAAKGEDAVMAVLLVLLSGHVAEYTLVPPDLDDDGQAADDEPAQLLRDRCLFQRSQCRLLHNRWSANRSDRSDPEARAFPASGQRHGVAGHPRPCAGPGTAIRRRTPKRDTRRRGRALHQGHPQRR